MKKHTIVIIGAGPAGLGAGTRLSSEVNGKALGKDRASWKIFEATGRVGGLSSSRQDKNGFTWDLGGHVIFSKSRTFNSVVKKALGDEALIHIRSSFVRMGGRFIPFPLQNNIHRLPKKISAECLEGMKNTALSKGRPKNFKEWIYHTLGRGLAEHFMLPYNRKLWGRPLDEMGYGWIDGRVSLPPLESVKRAMRTGIDQTRWGPNATFVFPLHGGTGGLFDKIADTFLDKIEFRQKAAQIDPKRKIVRFKGAGPAQAVQVVRYEKLITAAPLDVLVKEIIDDAPREVVDAADRLASNSGWIVGIGINRKISTKRCWVYFPNPETPFYRVTYFSNYSPNNVPDPKRQTSFLCEIPQGQHGSGDIAEKTIDALIREGLLRQSDKILVATRWKIKLPHLYPIPTLARDTTLKTIHTYLKKHGIYSIGRFGGWRYEKGNMDHAFVAGYKAAGDLFPK